MDTMTSNDQDPGPRRRPIWLKIVGIGCGAIVVLMLVAAGLVAFNWPRLSGYFQQAKSMMSQIMAVQAAVQKKYGAQVRITLKHESGVQGSILSVALVDAPLMDNIKVDGPEGRAAALEVASTARDALPPGGGYDNYEVVFLRERGVMSGNWSFRFAASELPPAKPESGG
jgi:hypothetical protein